MSNIPVAPLPGCVNWTYIWAGGLLAVHHRTRELKPWHIQESNKLIESHPCRSLRFESELGQEAISNSILENIKP